MSKQVSPEAFFDSLSIGYKLDSFLEGFKLQEINLFSYFSSILYGYQGNNVSDWGYKYIIDSAGYPFSDALNEASERHIQNGSFEKRDKRDDYYVVSSRGATEYVTFKSLESLAWREKFIDAACTTNILVPYSQTLRALLDSPDLQKSKEIDNWLDQSGIYNKISQISEAVGVPTGDLIIPAVSWIKYLTIEEDAHNKSGNT
jgi:hypothetical protein